MNSRNRKTLNTAIIALLALSATFAAPTATRSAGTQTETKTRLNVWQGHWRYHERDYNTAYSTAGTNDGTANCDWTPNGGFLLCDFLNEKSAGGVPLNDLAIMSYDPVTKTYARTQIFIGRKPIVNKVTVDGDTWITSVDIPYKGKTLALRDVYVFSPEGKLRNTVIQISANRGRTWTTISRFTAVKLEA